MSENENMKSKLFFIFFVLSFCFISCYDDKNFVGDWEIVSLKKDDVYQTIAVSDLKVINKDGKFFVAGNSGVNLFNGQIKNKAKDKIIIENLASTRMMGSPQAMEFENLFLETLTGTVNINIQDDILTLTNPEKKLELKFERQTEK